MSSTVSDVVFSEPSGTRQALVLFASSLLFAGLYGYQWTADAPSRGSWLLVMVAGTALSGVAESLPADRRRTAGLLRVTAISVLSSLVATIVVAPEVVVGAS